MIHPTCIIHPTVVFEDIESVEIAPYCVIGGPPEDKKFFGKSPEFGVFIKKGVRLSEFVTIHHGTVKDTVIGENTIVFQKTHIAHDCFIGKDCIIGGGVSLAGHTHVMDGANISGKSATIPKIVIGAYAFVGNFSLVVNHLAPGMKAVGYPARPIAINEVGLSRAGLTHSQCLDEYEVPFCKITTERKI